MNVIRQVLMSISLSGTSELGDHEAQKRIAIGINMMCLSIIGINCTIGVLAYLITGKNLILLGISVENAIVVIPILLNRYKKYLLAALVFFFTIACATGYFSCVLGKSVDSQLMIIYLIGLAIFIYERLIAQLTGIAVAMGMIIFIEYNYTHDLIKPIALDPNVQLFMRWAVYGVVIFLVIITFAFYKKNNNILLSRLQEHSKRIENNLLNEEKKNEIKDRFIGNASHEMKVSFHSIFAIIHILYKLEKQAQPGKRVKQSLDDLRAACKISQSIIDNILEYERYEAGREVTVNYQLINIRVLISNIIEIYKYLADERNVTIHQQVSPEIPQHILCDEMILRHIITNLLHNAIKFTRNGSAISINFQLDNKTLLLSVVDQGEGIANPNIESIFAPFVTQNPEGLGLGLYIVKMLATSLNGKITVPNSSISGTEFTLTFPLIEGEPKGVMAVERSWS